MSWSDTCSLANLEMTPCWRRIAETFASSADGRHDGNGMTGGRIRRSISSSLVRCDMCIWSKLGIYGFGGLGLCICSTSVVNHKKKIITYLEWHLHCPKHVGLGSRAKRFRDKIKTVLAGEKTRTSPTKRRAECGDLSLRSPCKSVGTFSLKCQSSISHQ